MWHWSPMPQLLSRNTSLNVDMLVSRNQNRKIVVVFWPRGSRSSSSRQRWRRRWCTRRRCPTEALPLSWTWRTQRRIQISRQNSFAANFFSDRARHHDAAALEFSFSGRCYKHQPTFQAFPLTLEVETPADDFCRCTRQVVLLWF